MRTALVHPQRIQSHSIPYPRNKPYDWRYNTTFSNQAQQESLPVQRREVTSNHTMGRGQRGNYVYNRNEFPPLPIVQDDKINNLTSAVNRIENCIEYLMGCQNLSQPLFNKNITPNSNNNNFQDGTIPAFNSMPPHGNQNVSQVPLGNPLLTRSQVAKNSL